ncbi:hypothetical protein GCM10027300_40030 [Modestobacter lapidis]
MFEDFQQLVAQVPEALQPVIVAAAGAVPFIEGEGAAAIGIFGGLNPVVAAIAAATGNFLCVTLLVLLGSRARTALVGRSYDTSDGRRSKRRQKFQHAFERYGVPGVSLLGPLLVPTQFTATALVTSGVRVLAWQAAAIAVWTTPSRRP